MMIMDEEKSWRELPFQPEGLETGGPLKAWSPINPPDTTPGYCAACALGTFYACSLIDHLKQYAEVHGDEMGERLTEIVETIVQRGKLEPVDRMFLGALGSYIATGRMNLSNRFNAVPIEPLLVDDAAEPGTA